MVINMKPYISLPFNSESLEYAIGISTNKSLIDQKRNIIRVLPGYQTVVKVIPQLVGTSLKFNEMDVSSRKCKLPYETEGLRLITDYTRIGCEFECAVSKAISLCKCMPWYFPNNYTNIPVCDAYGGHCFEESPGHCLVGPDRTRNCLFFAHPEKSSTKNKNFEK